MLTDKEKSYPKEISGKLKVKEYQKNLMKSNRP